MLRADIRMTRMVSAARHPCVCRPSVPRLLLRVVQILNEFSRDLTEELSAANGPLLALEHAAMGILQHALREKTLMFLSLKDKMSMV